MQDVGTQHLVLAGQGVDDHLHAGCAEGEVVERPAARLVAVVVDLRRAVETGARQRDLGEIGQLHQLLEADDLVTHAHMAVAKLHIFLGDLVVPGGEFSQALLEDLGGILRGLAVQVGAAGGGRGRGVGHLVGVGCGDLDAAEIDLEHLRHYLRDLGVQALAHLGAAVVQVNAAVGIDVDQRAGLVEEGGGERDTELDRRQRQTLLQDRAVGVEATDRLAALGIVAAGLEFGGHLFEHVVLDGLVVVSDVALGLAVVVGLAHCQGIAAQVAGDVVHHLLDGDHPLRAAEATVGGVGGGVGLAAVAMHRGIAQVVGVVGVEHGAVDDRA